MQCTVAHTQVYGHCLKYSTKVLSEWHKNTTMYSCTVYTHRCLPKMFEIFYKSAQWVTQKFYNIQLYTHRYLAKMFEILIIKKIASINIFCQCQWRQYMYSWFTNIYMSPHMRSAYFCNLICPWIRYVLSHLNLKLITVECYNFPALNYVRARMNIFS